MEIREIDLTNQAELQEWQNFLTGLGIDNFTEAEIKPIQKTLGIFENDKLVATGSYTRNVLKYLGVCHKSSQPGQLFNRIVSELMNRLAQNNIFHVMVFTKPEYIASFEQVGFHLIVKNEYSAFLETGDQSIQQYVNHISKFIGGQKIGAIVMNANPFTNGHRYLVEKAAKECDGLYVFVVATDMSLFSPLERFEMVREGIRDLPNVQIFSGKDYLVSYATFPAYFLKHDDDKVAYQTQIDALIFKDWIAKAGDITDRYVGTEPKSVITAKYNETLKAVLEPEINVHVVPRLKEDGEVVSARTIRQLIQSGDLATIKTMVPKMTYRFIADNLTELQNRIKEGMSISGN